MRAWVVSGTALLGLAVLLAAQEGGAASPHEAVVKDLLTTVEQVIAVLKDVKDEAGVNAARPDLKKAGERLKDLRKRTKELKQPDRAEKERIEKKYQGKLDEVLKKLRNEQIRVRAIPGGADAVKEIAVAPEEKKKKKK